MLVKCPKCRCEIEPDSYFCDQCGAELYICPQCKIFGRGKRCTQCGTELVKASEFQGYAVEPQSQDQSQSQGQNQSQGRNQPQGTQRPGQSQGQSQSQPGHLVAQSHHIRLGLEAGVIIGRRGSYPSVFASFGDVSGNHARIDKNGDTWTVTDIGSTNGTFVNGRQLQPNMPQNIQVGDTIRFSTLEFQVEP